MVLKLPKDYGAVGAVGICPPTGSSRTTGGGIDATLVGGLQSKLHSALEETSEKWETNTWDIGLAWRNENGAYFSSLEGGAFLLGDSTSSKHLQIYSEENVLFAIPLAHQQDASKRDHHYCSY